MLNSNYHKRLLVITKYFLLISCSIVAVFPFYWMLTTAFSKDFWINNPQFFPIPPYLNSFKQVLVCHPFLRWITNTTIISFAGTIGNLFFASLAAFAFACLRFRYRDLIFYILLSSMILPGFLMVIPRFFIIIKLGGMNKYWGVFLPTWFSMFSVFLLRQYFFSIPRETLNAARIDGANIWQIYWRIVLPAGKPILFALFVISFLGNWNSFLWPLIIIRTVEMQTLPVGISTFYGLYHTLYNNVMAGSLISLIPIFIIFILFQKYISKGLDMRIKF